MNRTDQMATVGRGAGLCGLFLLLASSLSAVPPILLPEEVLLSADPPAPDFAFGQSVDADFDRAFASGVASDGRQHYSAWQKLSGGQWLRTLVGSTSPGTATAASPVAVNGGQVFRVLNDAAGGFTVESYDFAVSLPSWSPIWALNEAAATPRALDVVTLRLGDFAIGTLHSVAYTKFTLAGFRTYWVLIGGPSGTSTVFSDSYSSGATPSTSLDQNRAVLGLPGLDDVIVVEGSGFDPWNEEQVIGGPRLAEAFGAAVALNGNLLAVGAPATEVCTPVPESACTDSGQVYLYALVNGVWQYQQALLNGTEGVEAGARFGASLSFDRDGQRLAIGAPGPVGGAGQGLVFTSATYLASWSGASWALDTSAQPLARSSAAGSAIAFSSDGDLLVGAPDYKVEGTVVGAVVVFRERVFADGFESGSTSSWSSVIP